MLEHRLYLFSVIVMLPAEKSYVSLGQAAFCQFEIFKFGCRTNCEVDWQTLSKHHRVNLSLWQNNSALIMENNPIDRALFRRAVPGAWLPGPQQYRAHTRCQKITENDGSLTVLLVEMIFSPFWNFSQQIYDSFSLPSPQNFPMA